MKRSDLRDIAFKIIYQYNFNNSLENIKDNFIDYKNVNFSEKDRQYVDDVIENYWKNKEKVNSLIKNSLSEDWEINRLSSVDLGILRLAITETLFIEDVSYKIAFDEAIQLSKKYSDDKSPGFINAVLADFLKTEGIS